MPLPMPVEVRLRPIREDILEVAQKAPRTAAKAFMPAVRKAARPDVKLVSASPGKTEFRLRPPYGATRMLSKWLKADPTATDNLGWSANLAIFRLVFLSLVTLPLGIQIVHWTATTMPSLPREIWRPISFYRWIPDDYLRDAGIAHCLALIDVCAILFGLVGFYTRSTLGLAAILSLYLFGLPQNLGMVYHVHQNVWFLALLAAGPSGDMLSMDAVLAAIRRARRGRLELTISGSSSLATLRYVWVLIGLLYFSAGLGKLVAAWHFHWLDSTNLQNLIRERWLAERLYTKNFSRNIRFDELPSTLLQAGAGGTIAFELLALFLVLFRGTRWTVILCGLAFHLNNGILLGIWFNSLVFAYVSMVDWAWIGRMVMKRAGLGPVVIVYDDTCEFCRSAIGILKTIDICAALKPETVTSQEDANRPVHFRIAQEMLARDLYVLGDNFVAGGYEAYALVTARIPLLWPLAVVMRLTPVAALGRRLYRRVVDSRHCRLKQGTGCAFSTVPISRNGSNLAPHFIGIALIVGEAVTVALKPEYGLVALRSVMGQDSIEQELETWHAEKWVWPFDRYPTFAKRYLGTYRTWEPRLTYSDGSESAIPPRVFARTFGDQLDLAEVNLRQALKQSDPLSRRQYALTMAGMLWSNVPSAAKDKAMGIRGYDTIYSNDPDDREPRSRRLIDFFSLEELLAEVRANQTSRSEKHQ